MQQASISVSTLKCDPYDDSVTLYDLDSKIKDNDSKLEKLIKTQTGTVWFDATRLVLK